MDMIRHFLAPAGLVAGLAACSAPGDPVAKAGTPGAELYLHHCAMCHGADGTLGRGGAKNLAASALSKDEAAAVIGKGRGAMAGFGRVLSRQQLEEVADHVFTLRNTGEPAPVNRSAPAQ